MTNAGYAVLSVFGTVFGILIIYLVIRLASHAYYRSKKEFMEWYHDRSTLLDRKDN